MKKFKIFAKEIRGMGITDPDPRTILAIGQVAMRIAKEQRYSKLQMLEIISSIVEKPNSAR